MRQAQARRTPGGVRLCRPLLRTDRRYPRAGKPVRRLETKKINLKRRISARAHVRLAGHGSGDGKVWISLMTLVCQPVMINRLLRRLPGAAKAAAMLVNRYS